MSPLTESLIPECFTVASVYIPQITTLLEI